MNEQLQNLKDKIWTEEYWTNPKTDRLLPAQLNKFAKLIVRECIDIAQAYDGDKLSGAGTVIANRIDAHFEVNEE